jgi:hypothetical protein
MTRQDSGQKAPPRRLLLREGLSLLVRVWRGFGRLGVHGPEDGPPVMVIPGFLATDRTTLGLQRALARAGYRVTGWGLGMNTGVQPETLDGIIGRLEAFAGGRPVILIGWSLGGLYAREAAKQRPDLVSKVVTMGSPFSGDRRANNAWRLYELVAGHPVDNPPIEADVSVKPPVPTLALWSRRDGIVAPACARGQADESDRQVEIDCSHMGFAVDGKAYPAIIAALKD